MPIRATFRRRSSASDRRIGRLALTATVCLAGAAIAEPGDDSRTDIQREITRTHDYFLDRFPDISLGRYGKGSAPLAPIAERETTPRPSHPPTTADAESLYDGCLPENARTVFPRYDETAESVVTLRQAINDCRIERGESRLDESEPELDRIEAALSDKARGLKLTIPVPSTDKDTAWFERGRFQFHAKRGQRNLSCANCHVQHASARYENAIISASLSHALRYPAYDGDELISLHDQYAICSEQRTGAQSFTPQSDEFKALEYYQSVISSGIPLAAPARLE